MSLAGRHALVTAASSGIGRGIAARLRAEGAQVFLTGNEPDLTEEAAAEIGAVGCRVADFSRPGAALGAAGAALDALGGVDILVSNTGGPPPGSFLDLTAEDWERSYRLVLESALHLTRAVLPGMIERGWGRIVYMTSSGVTRPLPQLHLSNVMRAGVAALAQSIAVEAGREGVTVNVVAPAHIDTARTQQILASVGARHDVDPDQVRARALATIPVGRFGTVEDVAALVAFLCGDDAGFLTGSVHLVDGGYTKYTEVLS